eukprot:CAMPEP_0204530902 /NCGR_PEP_ID=MMETSP0661-20131031/10877_1 /ASSEMBLY_ACC=CAM_ASM_000606 /TAXON_ID=109239 /ORGANISM="Alexandrium margalefi, Strain AMGDE01CS-322" /LENGTH=42 /DNA_ID= /DNA_START= /DNA_END= /DNA_ORIENTATION=
MSTNILLGIGAWPEGDLEGRSGSSWMFVLMVLGFTVGIVTGV